MGIFAAFASIILAPRQDCSAQKRPEVGGTIIAGPTIELLSVAVEDFKTPEGFTTIDDSLLIWDMHKVLKDDLIFSLYFNVVSVDSSFLANFAKGKMNLDDWIYLGAQMLISGKVEREGEGIVFTLDVTDIYRNKNIYDRDFAGPAKNYRYLAHQAASDILFNLTGEEGCFYSKLAFSCDATGNAEIYICDFDGYAPREITANKSINVLPIWSPDGDRVYFTSYLKGNPDLYAYAFSQDKSLVISARSGLNSAAAASPDGKYIACTLTIDGNAEIYLLDPGGKIVRRLTYVSMIDSSPAWAPSSRELAFTSDRTGTPQIYIMDIEGLNTRRLTYEGDYNDQASWSPRGDLIAYSSRETDGFQIYTIDITGQYAKKLTEIGTNESPSWSPDGLHLAFSHVVDNRFQLFTMNYDGNNKRQIPLPGNCKSPDWSKNTR